MSLTQGFSMLSTELFAISRVLQEIISLLPNYYMLSTHCRNLIRLPKDARLLLDNVEVISYCYHTSIKRKFSKISYTNLRQTSTVLHPGQALDNFSKWFDRRRSTTTRLLQNHTLPTPSRNHNDNQNTG